ncbi:phosphoribosylformylglycinamidine synthase [Candidatus Saccharibacteria bacterium]|nr:phosphoribosylformylglycinamidine synthase [Candidatus Saccharibacteria bacterium]
MPASASQAKTQLIRLYRRVPNFAEAGLANVEAKIRSVISDDPVAMEWCYYVETTTVLNKSEIKKLTELLAETFDPQGFGPNSFLARNNPVIEVGSRLSFETPWASTARQICHSVGLTKVNKIERSRRFGFDKSTSKSKLSQLADVLHDRMTEAIYDKPPHSLTSTARPEPVHSVAVMKEGIKALRRANTEFGLAMDEHDLQRYYDLFVNQLKRNPTDVELFQLGQGNSEHSRHGFFKGKIVLDGKQLKDNLMDVVKAPYKSNPNNSVIAFHDDSSAIRGKNIVAAVAEGKDSAGKLKTEKRLYHPTLTAETHNFPTGIAPYPGAATGTGGRIRDNQAVGRGGLVVASGVGYCVANMNLAGYDLPWELDGHSASSNQATPFEILIEASNGASDYGNCFGEPVILGHLRSFGLQTPGGYRAWYKPILYTEGVGQIDDRHTKKGEPRKGMLVVQIGGPAYRIGMGGAAASSLMSGENVADLDFNAVQRGAPEMEQRLNRVVRACVELGDSNPIISAHDLGAGGDSNALPEIVHPTGGRINLRAIPSGDASLSVLELWGNESQERNVFLVRPSSLKTLGGICSRENAPLAVVGEVTGDGNLVVFDEKDSSTPINLPLEPILGEVEPRTLELKTQAIKLKPIRLSKGISVEDALERVLRLPSVASKSWLVRKVDRSVTGLVAQQQGVGPYNLPLSNYGVVAHSLFDKSGTALSEGERPTIGLISPGAQARMSVAEALTNIMGAAITKLEDIRASANWMWAAKLSGEGARLHEAATAMSSIMIKLGIAVDGGKDSLSMASKDGSKFVKAPGQLVVAAYAVMPDITKKVTPEFKKPGNTLLYIDLAKGKARLGGSALAQVYGQLGDGAPDVEDVTMLARCFNAIQELVRLDLICSLHDRSDGGLISSLIEMSVVGGFGARININGQQDELAAMFNEELGLVLECADKEKVDRILKQYNMRAVEIGTVANAVDNLAVSYNGQPVLNKKVAALRHAWDETSTKLDALQTNPTCVAEEANVVNNLTSVPNYKLSFVPQKTDLNIMKARYKPKVAILREEGTNGDREMAASFMAAGFEAWDVAMHDLLNGSAKLADFRGVAFAGGFSFGDVLDSARGWASVINFNPKLAKQFNDFYNRQDSFSLGVCNGAQLMALLGWVPGDDLADPQKPRFSHNQSGRFESRFTTVEILHSPSIMLKEMAGTRMGVWVAHGEGRLHVPDEGVMQTVLNNQLAPIRFVDYSGKPTTKYPFNPNGSPGGITALCSADGRHLAMMPHPERLANALWQWPWLPEDWKSLKASPWLRMFQNARDWCEESK